MPDQTNVLIGWDGKGSSTVGRKFRGTWRDQLPLVVAGLMLTAAFAFAGHYIGRSAVAHNADASDMASLLSPTSALSSKGSLLPEDLDFSTLNASALRRQTVMVEGKTVPRFAYIGPMIQI